MSLRKALIKLAYDNPKVREDVLPLLEEKQAAEKVSPNDLKPGLKIKAKDNPEWGTWTVKNKAKGVPGAWEIQGRRGSKVLNEGNLRFWEKAASTKEASATKQASMGVDIMKSRVDPVKFGQLAREAKAGGWDKLLRQFREELATQLQPAPNVERALNRFANLCHSHLDEASARNQAFKVADELKIRLPHGIFASEKQGNAVTDWENWRPAQTPALVTTLKGSVADLKKQVSQAERAVKYLSDIVRPLGPKAVAVYVRKEKEHLANRKRLLKEIEAELKAAEASVKKNKTAKVSDL